jgi:carbon storage regulator
MLILSRKESECIHLGDDIVVTIVRVNGDKVRIGVQAPPHVKILRTELELNWEENPQIPTSEPQQSIRRAA